MIKIIYLQQENRSNPIPNIDKEIKSIEDKHKEVDNENLRNCGILKGELRSLVDREGLNLRGVDETDADAVAVHEESLKYIKEDEDNESVASLEIHDPLDQTSSIRKAENPGEGPSKTYDTGKTPTNKENNDDLSLNRKRSIDEDSNEEESSRGLDRKNPMNQKDQKDQKLNLKKKKSS